MGSIDTAHPCNPNVRKLSDLHWGLPPKAVVPLRQVRLPRLLRRGNRPRGGNGWLRPCWRHEVCAAKQHRQLRRGRPVGEPGLPPLCLHAAPRTPGPPQQHRQRCRGGHLLGGIAADNGRGQSKRATRPPQQHWQWRCRAAVGPGRGLLADARGPDDWGRHCNWRCRRSLRCHATPRTGHRPHRGPHCTDWQHGLGGGWSTAREEPEEGRHDCRGQL
mmetsp:Transcript_34597/g.87909  ORF Transcript_34597/g.87909 Transcript_34597/m.87909 type:complete len:217 (-) Transcript_34597:58-708(-)